MGLQAHDDGVAVRRREAEKAVVVVVVAVHRVAVRAVSSGRLALGELHRAVGSLHARVGAQDDPYLGHLVGGWGAFVFRVGSVFAVTADDKARGLPGHAQAGTHLCFLIVPLLIVRSDVLLLILILFLVRVECFDEPLFQLFLLARGGQPASIQLLLQLSDRHLARINHRESAPSSPRWGTSVVWYVYAVRER